MPAKKPRKPRAPRPKKEKPIDITQPFANDVLNLIGRITPSVHDPDFSAIANSLLFVKNTCVEMMEGKRTIS